MKITINLYTGMRYNLEEVRSQVSDKNPVVFIVSKENDESVYSMMNISSRLKKYICIANSFDTPRVVAYLASFDNTDDLKVLMMAPSNKRDKAILFTKRVVSCVNRVSISKRLKIR